MSPEISSTETLRSVLLEEAINEYYNETKPGEPMFMALADFVRSLDRANDQSYRSSLDAIISARESGVAGYAEEMNVIDTVYYHLALFLSQENPDLPQENTHAPTILPDAAKSMAFQVLQDLVTDLYNEQESDDSSLIEKLLEISSLKSWR